MGVLFSKVWQAFFSYDEFKVIIVGLNNAGKTTTLYKLYARAHPPPTTLKEGDAACIFILLFIYLLYFKCTRALIDDWWWWGGEQAVE
jgi:ABC-type sugar transport system permease subunit